MYYNYHARLLNLLETTPYEVEIALSPFAYRFIFNNGKSMPIRPYKIPEYIEYLTPLQEQTP